MTAAGLMPPSDAVDTGIRKHPLFHVAADETFKGLYRVWVQAGSCLVGVACYSQKKMC